MSYTIAKGPLKMDRKAFKQTFAQNIKLALIINYRKPQLIYIDRKVYIDKCAWSKCMKYTFNVQCLLNHRLSLNYLASY